MVGVDVPIHAILAGRIARFGDKGEPSAIAKTPLAGDVTVGFLGLEGDEQADLVHHGGPDKAIHHYPHDHYPFWQSELGAHPLLEHYGAFGENIATTGLTESALSIGDRFRLGTAIVEVSQGRQPCWKLGHRFGNAKVPARVVATGRSGWYYRVIEPGTVSANERFTLLDRPFPQWTVELVFSLLIGGKGKTQPTLVKELASLPVLAENWRVRAAKLVGG